MARSNEPTPADLAQYLADYAELNIHELKELCRDLTVLIDHPDADGAAKAWAREQRAKVRSRLFRLSLAMRLVEPAGSS